MNRLDQFLNIAARQMRAMPAALRDDELRELRGHLQQRAQDYTGEGMSEDEAQIKALEGLGSPRKLGAKLCDAWEGIAWSWWRLIAAIAGVTAFLLFAVLALIWAMALLPLSDSMALLPEVVPLLCGVYIVSPLFCGALFSHWLGRRGCLVATLYFLALALGNFTVIFPESAAFAAPPANFVAIVNGAWFAYFWTALAFIGAYAESTRHRQARYLATVGAHSLPLKRRFWVRFNLRLWRNALLFAVLGGALYAGRVWRQFHPQTPTATLRNYLVLNRQMNGGDFEAPLTLATRELSPQSAAEIAGQRTRIWFQIELRMTPQYAARRVAYLKQLINRPEKERPFEDKTLRLSLTRMQRNRQIIQGTASLIKTPTGWKVDEKSFDSSRLSGWAYDLAYQRGNRPNQSPLATMQPRRASVSRPK